MKIKDVVLENNLIAAPLAGYTNIALRRLYSELGAAMTVTEMVSVKGLLYGNEKTNDLLKTDAAEKVVCVQLFGREPQDFYRAASLNELRNFDAIDVNMGCPVKKIVGNGEGSALILEPSRAADIVAALKSAVNKPITVKMRSGFNSSDEAVPFARAVAAAGADMIAIHPRTAKQMYGGKADYAVAKAVVEAVDIPVALSGDIDAETFDEARKTGAAAFMLGRGALADPTLFATLRGADSPSRKECFLKLIDYMSLYFGDAKGAINFRKYLAYMLKGVRGGKEFKMFAADCESIAKLKSVAEKLVF